jgi:hypothetical protein
MLVATARDCRKRVSCCCSAVDLIASILTNNVQR